MSTSSPVRTRKQRRPTPAGSDWRPRGESVVTVVRSIILAVAAISVIGTSNYFAYMIGRKQATYEELRRQVDRVVQLMQVEEQPAPPTAKPQQDRLEQNAPGFIDLTTSTINGKTTVVAPGPLPPPPATAAAPVDAVPAAQPDQELRSRPRETPPGAVIKHRAMRGAAIQRGARPQKAPKSTPADAFAQQPSQSTTAAPAPDAGLANQ